MAGLQKAVAQVASAEAALRSAAAYEDAMAANEAAKPRTEPWPPDARIAPPGYSSPNPMAQHSRPQVPFQFIFNVPPTLPCKQQNL